MAFKLSLLHLVPHALAVEGPGAFFTGFAEGLLGESKDVRRCAQDFGHVAGTGVKVVEDFIHKDLNKTVADLQELVVAVSGSVRHCKGAASELKPFLHVLDGVHGPGDLYQKLKQNGLNNDEAILAAFEGAGKYCTFAEPNGELCGQSFGRPVRLLLLGGNNTELALGVSGPGAFLSGLAEGLLGDSQDIQTCGTDLGSVAKSAGHLIEDLHNKNVNGTVADIQNLLLALQGSVGDCKSAAGELKPFLHILDGVHSPADLYQKIKHNILSGDESIIDAFEGAGKYCTFRAPNGHKCGKSLGRPLRIILLGPDALELSMGGPGNFFAGFAEGLIGDATDVQHCGKDLKDVSSAGAHLIADLGKFNVTRTVQDIEQLVHAFSASASDCKSAVADLKPFLHILDGVHSPGDLYAKLKKNGLDNDEAILNSFEGAAKFCTFADPNGRKCGKSLGTPIRLILVGSESVVV